MQITVMNKRHGASGIYIGRGSALGNPFTHLDVVGTVKCADRNEACDRHAAYLREKIDAGDEAIVNQLTLIYRAAEKGPINLICYCAPLRCHGDTIKQIVLDAWKKQQP